VKRGHEQYRPLNLRLHTRHGETRTRMKDHDKFLVDGSVRETLIQLLVSTGTGLQVNVYVFALAMKR